MSQMGRQNGDLLRSREPLDKLKGSKGPDGWEPRYHCRLIRSTNRSRAPESVDAQSVVELVDWAATREPSFSTGSRRETR